MSQATINADSIGASGQAVSARRGRQLAIILASALLGAALALAVNAGVNMYQAKVAADQAALATAAQLEAQRSLFLASERAGTPAQLTVTDNDRAIAAHLKSERNESVTWSVPQSGVPAFMQSERSESAGTTSQSNTSHWTVPQGGVPAFMQSERDETPASH